MQRKLYLVRHGIAVDPAQFDGDDGVRPLTEQGFRLVKLAAQALGRSGVEPRRILTSPLLRATQTAAVIASALGIEQRLHVEPRLAPGFQMSALSELLEIHAERKSLMLVGHEPDLSAILSCLIGGGRVNFKKGAIALVQLINAQPPSGTLEWMVTPRLLLGERSHPGD